MVLKRHQEMQLLANDLRKEVLNFERSKINLDLYGFAFSELRSRMEGLPLRAYFLKKSYELLRTKSPKNKFTFSNKVVEEFTIKLPFVFEVIITIQYLHNQILDKKAGVTTPEAINENLLAGNILKDFLYEYIENNFSKNTAKPVTQAVRKAFHYVDIGQYLEKKWNTLDHFKESHKMESISISEEIDKFIDFSGMEIFLDSIWKMLPLETHVYTETYLKRIYLTCGALFKLAGDLLCDLLQVDQKIQRQFSSFSATYGLMRQIINDNADVVPYSRQLQTQHRLAEDAFSDWNNENITLPLILLMVEDKTIQSKYAPPVKLNAQENLFSTLLSSNALFKSIHQARLLAAVSKKLLPFSCEQAQLLLDTCEIANWNKFLAPCIKTKEYALFKKTEAYVDSKNIIKKIELKSSKEGTLNEAVNWHLDLHSLFPIFKQLPV